MEMSSCYLSAIASTAETEETAPPSEMSLWYLTAMPSIVDFCYFSVTAFLLECMQVVSHFKLDRCWTAIHNWTAVLQVLGPLPHWGQNRSLFAHGRDKILRAKCETSTCKRVKSSQVKSSEVGTGHCACKSVRATVPVRGQCQVGYRRASRRRARARESLRSPINQKSGNFRVVESGSTRRDDTSFSLETLRVPIHDTKTLSPRRNAKHQHANVSSQVNGQVDSSEPLCLCVGNVTVGYINAYSQHFESTSRC